MRWTILAAVAAAAVLTTTACGSAGAAGSSTLGGAASIVPSDAAAFVAVDTNLSSDQWQTVDGLLKKFPSSGTFLTQLRQSFEQHSKLSWANDVKPALGDELDVVALAGAKPQAVGLAQPHDQAKFDALLKKLGSKVVSEQISGWTAFADSRSALDAVKSATSHLADNGSYGAATAKLSSPALAHAYANGPEAQKLVGALRQGAQTQSLPFDWAAADVVASDGGVRVDAFSHASSSAAGQQTQPYTSSLVDQIPSGVLAVADFVVKPGRLGSVTLPAPLQKMLGSSTLPSQLDTILGGETAVYVRRGVMIPEITLVTQPSDTSSAVSALDDLLAQLKTSGAGGIFSQVQPVHAVVDGRLVVSTSQQGIADFTSSGSKLSSDSGFTDAQHAASMPSQTTGFVYVNVKDTLPLVQAFAPMAGMKLPPSLQGADLSALRSLVAYGTRTGDDEAYTAFAQVQ